MVKKLELKSIAAFSWGSLGLGCKQESCVMANVFLMASLIIGPGYPFSINLDLIIADWVLKSQSREAVRDVL